MVTIGFRELLEKLEEYFGKGVVRLFLGTVGLFATLFVIGVAVQASVYPAAVWIGAIITGQPGAGDALNGFGTIVSVLWIVMAATLVLWTIRAIRLMKRVLGPDGRQLLEKVLQAHDEMEADKAKIRQHLAEAKATLDEARRTKSLPSSDPEA